MKLIFMSALGLGVALATACGSAADRSATRAAADGGDAQRLVALLDYVAADYGAGGRSDRARCLPGGVRGDRAAPAGARRRRHAGSGGALPRPAQRDRGRQRGGRGHPRQALDRALGRLQEEGALALPAVAAFLIYLREGVEAALLVGALLAGLRRLGRTDALPWVHGGWMAALAAALSPGG